MEQISIICKWMDGKKERKNERMQKSNKKIAKEFVGKWREKNLQKKEEKNELEKTKRHEGF